MFCLGLPAGPSRNRRRKISNDPFNPAFRALMTGRSIPRQKMYENPRGFPLLGYLPLAASRSRDGEEVKNR